MLAAVAIAAANNNNNNNNKQVRHHGTSQRMRCFTVSSFQNAPRLLVVFKVFLVATTVFAISVWIVSVSNQNDPRSTAPTLVVLMKTTKKNPNMSNIINTNSHNHHQEPQEHLVSSASNVSASVLQRGQVENDDGTTTEYFWQTPPFSSTIASFAPPRAILFVAHGCGHNMKDWWPRQLAV